MDAYPFVVTVAVGCLLLIGFRRNVVRWLAHNRRDTGSATALSPVDQVDQALAKERAAAAAAQAEEQQRWDAVAVSQRWKLIDNFDKNNRFHRQVCWEIRRALGECKALATDVSDDTSSRLHYDDGTLRLEYKNRCYETKYGTEKCTQSEVVYWGPKSDVCFRSWRSSAWGTNSDGEQFSNDSESVDDFVPGPWIAYLHEALVPRARSARDAAMRALEEQRQKEAAEKEEARRRIREGT